MLEITMPRLSDTMEEGTIAEWLKRPGDHVEAGDVLVEIETDKALMQYEAYESGTLAEILVEKGTTVAIGTTIALVDNGSSSPASKVTASLDDASTPQSPPRDARGTGGTVVAERTGAPNRTTPAAASPMAAASTAVAGERRFLSPVVRRLARDHQLDLGSVTGSGPMGRIIRRDVEGLIANPVSTNGDGAVPTALAADGDAREAPQDLRGTTTVPMSTARRVIARRLSESARTIPHFYVTARADVEALVELRAELNNALTKSGRQKVSINDFFIRACALALRDNPLVNVSYLGESSTEMQVHSRINIGVAVASESGLVVPVIFDADHKGIVEIAAESKMLVAAAGEKRLTLEQMTGGTFTISNLGMFDVEQFTAIINPPEAAILAVGGLEREAVVHADQIEARHLIRYTLSVDHRAIDGALAAKFLQSLTGLLENPFSIVA